MSYLRNPHYPGFWESDGEYTGKYKADDGSLYDSAKEADNHDAAARREREMREREASGE